MRKSNWYKIYICSICRKQLSSEEKMDSRGCCPYCGKSSAMPTICSTNDVVLREIKLHEWWWLFNRKTYYEGIDEFSKKWIEENKFNK